MKIALISTGKSAQDKDLLKEAKRRNHQLAILQIGQLPLSSFEKTNTSFLDFDLIYWRVGSPKIRQIVALKANQNKIPFINSGYWRYPLLGEKSYQLYKVSLLGIKVPKTYLINAKNYQFSDLKKNLGLPLILKKNIGAMGKNVWLINNKTEIEKIIKTSSSREFLAQEFLPNNGDYRVLVVGQKAIGIFKRIPKSGEFKANIALGGHGEKVENQKISNHLKFLAEKICQALGLEIAGIDFIESREEFYFIESNSIVQWQGFQKTTKINVAEKIFDYFEQTKSRPN